MVDAVVLAGGLNNGRLKKCSPARFEALITIGTRAMVDYVVHALQHCPRVGRIVVVGPAEELAFRFNSGAVNVVAARDGIIKNIEAGLECLPEAKRVLLVTSDIPLLTAGIVENFLNLCGAMDADLYYPVVSRSAVERRFASARRTYVALKEGVFTGGNLFLVNPAAFACCVGKGEQLIDLRKSPLKLSRLLGGGFMLKFLFRFLTIGEVQEKVSQLLGIKGVAVISNDPEIGVDVDKPGDLDLVTRILETA